MRYRRLDPLTGDMQFGHGLGSFWIDVPDAVAQAAQTRLSLWLGDWFLDLGEGIDWLGRVLGNGTAGIYDSIVQQRILGTQGLRSITAYASQRNGDVRGLSIQVTIDTVYGPATFAAPRTVYGPPVVNPPVLLP